MEGTLVSTPDDASHKKGGSLFQAAVRLLRVVPLIILLLMDQPHISQANTQAGNYQIYLPTILRNWPSAIFVGLRLQWDGFDYIHASDGSTNYYGLHQQRVFDLMTDVDVIRASNNLSYDPN